jgi:exodeoxyribonuclease I
LLFRYRARNWPDSLSAPEQERWDAYRRHRLLDESGLSELSHAAFNAELAFLRTVHAGEGGRLALLDQLQAWGDDLVAGLT